MQPLISVIIPMYNQQEYIAQCLDSLLAQSYRNFEIIVVDDGSTDGCGKICDDYHAGDSRVLVEHMKNGGVGRARNRGLELMSGEWFCFVDADDWVMPDYLERLYTNAVTYDCDVSACCFLTCYSIGQQGVSGAAGRGEAKVLQLRSSAECVHNYICSDTISMNGMVWNKLYRAGRFRDIRFRTDIKVNEDCLYTFEIMKRCTNACLTSEELYCWYIREDSACHAKPKKLDFSAADVFVLLLGETEQLGDKAVERELRCNYVRCVLRVLTYLDFNARDEKVREVLERLKEWRRDVWSMLSRKERLVCRLIISAPGVLRVLRKLL